MDRYTSWKAFVNDVFDECGKSGEYLKAIYAAGGMALLFIIISMLGFGPYVFVTWLLGFLTTPPGWVVAAIFGAGAYVALRYLYSNRATVRPILLRVVEAKRPYEGICAQYPEPTSEQRRRRIDALFEWVLRGGNLPLDGWGPNDTGPDSGPEPVPA